MYTAVTRTTSRPPTRGVGALARAGVIPLPRFPLQASGFTVHESWWRNQGKGFRWRFQNRVFKV